MLRPPRRLTLAAVLAAATLTLAGCAPASDPGDGSLAIVASTNVYGQIAEELGGELVSVTSIIASASQDPHSYEASAQDQLRVKKADLIIENGGGYDTFMNTLIEGTGTTAPVITAATSSPEWPADADASDHIEGFNEHVWYDPAAIRVVAQAIAAELSELRPEDSAAFDANLAAFAAGIDGLESVLADTADTHSGAKAFATEPVPGYLLAAAGLIDVTPPAFSEAVEEGQDVPPATLLEALKLLRGGQVALVAANAQTGGAETTQVIDEAEGRGIPVVEFAETLPDGETYLQWMRDNIDAVAAARGS